MAVDTSREVAGAPGHEGGRRTIKRVEVGSVLKFSVLLAATVGLIVMLAGGVLYFVASTTGFVTKIQTFFNHYGYPDFRVQSSTVFGVLLLVTVVGAIAFVVVAMIAAFIFNIVAEASGGIKVTFRE
ncbi:MAG: DUF3566 domain-containing protein [Actinomycetota bacterium]